MVAIVVPSVIVLCLVALFIVYGPVAELLFHVWAIGTVTRGSELRRELALTFDDGPDPAHTPQLLALLREHDAKAVFFLIAEKARRHPELVHQIQSDGHVIGNHTDTHKNAWFLTPWQTSTEIIAATRTLEATTGGPVHYFRPPWGRFNLWQRLVLQRTHLTPVLWTFTARDWRAGDRTKEIGAALLAHAQSGGIVLLHDSGGAKEAPDNTLRALTEVLPRLRACGFTFSVRPVTEAAAAEAQRRGWFPRRSQRLIHPLWRVWDRLFDKIYRVYPMTRMFRLSVVDWRFGERRVEIFPSADSADTSALGGALAAGLDPVDRQGSREAAAATAIAPVVQEGVAEGAGPVADEAAAKGSRPVASGPATGHLDDPSAVGSSSLPVKTIVIRDGMPMVELHLQNLALQELVKIESPEKMAIRGLREVRDSLREVALTLDHDPRFSDAHGVFGMTMMHRGMDKLGFHVEDVPDTLFNRWVTLLLTWIMILYHPHGRRRLKQGLEEMHPRLMWMTREELIRAYSPQSGHGRGRR